MLLVEDFLHGEELDDSAGWFAERCAFLFRVASVAEGDEEAALAVSLHGPFSPAVLTQRSM